MLEAPKAQKLPGSHTLSVRTYREQFRELLATQSSEPVDTVRDFSIPGPDTDIPVRVYDPGGDGARPVVVSFHGGGWVLGGLDCYDNLCTRLANRAACPVVSVDYRLAPEHPFPAALNDSYAATAWVGRNAEGLGGDPDRIAVAGPSAGGGTLRPPSRCWHGTAAGRRSPTSISCPPVSTRSASGSSGVTGRTPRGTGPRRRACGGSRTRTAATASTGATSTRSRSRPRTSRASRRRRYSARSTPLRDEAFAYEERLGAEGVDVSHRHYGSMIHDFLSRTDEVDAATDGVETVAADLTEAFGQ